VEVPRWPENTPISANMISGPSVVPLTRIASNLSYSGSRLMTISQVDVQSYNPGAATASSRTHLEIPNQTNNKLADNSVSNPDGSKQEQGLSTRSSVIFKIPDRD